MKYDNKCANCGKLFENCSYAIDRRGTLPQIFCDGVCETEYKGKNKLSGNSKFSKDDQHKRLWEEGRLYGWKDNQTSGDVASKISQVAWHNEFLQGQGDINIKEV